VAKTPSTMLALGTEAPPFRLPTPDGKLVSLDDLRGGPGFVVAFVCNHCPYVKHIRDELARFGRDAAALGVRMAAISANDVDAYPADAPERMAEEARDAGYTFPYLYDESQEVAKAYRAACTPEFYLFDGDAKLVYRGRFDESRPGSQVRPTGAALREAVQSLVSGSPLPEEQLPSVGCNIKWKPGQEPDYA